MFGFKLKACAAGAALLSVALGQTAVAQAPVALPPTQALGAALGERSAAPGVVGAILRDGVVTEVFAWGGADCAGGGVADINAAYEIGSISKHVAAVALLRLWEQGRVDLDSRVGDYLDDIPEAWRPVTLRQLATHTSGVPDYEEAGGYGVYETEPTAAEVYAIVASRPLDFEPGTRWSYSNTGYFLLSKVVEQVSGERFGDYLRTRLFEPLGMHHSFMGGYAPADARLAQGCKPGEGPNAARIPVRPIHEASTFGAGGVSTTLQDWALWDDALHDGRLLSPPAMQVMLTPQRLADGSATSYGFGLFVDEFRGARRIQHTGQTQGFVADYQHYPDKDFSVVTLANMYGADEGGISRTLVFRVMPELSYDRMPVPSDPDFARTQAVRRALRQALLDEQPADLLSDGMRRFATSEQFVEARAQMRPYAEHADELAYLRSEPAGGDRHVYKLLVDGQTSYLVVAWREGRLAGLRPSEN
jgi:CubicO group peptidase (beta-lactamase class C family)